VTPLLRVILAALTRHQPDGGPKPMPEQQPATAAAATPPPTYAEHIVGGARWVPPQRCSHSGDPVFGPCSCHTT
jgi:hypothetical protein